MSIENVNYFHDEGMRAAVAAARQKAYEDGDQKKRKPMTTLATRDGGSQQSAGNASARSGEGALMRLQTLTETKAEKHV